MTSPTPLGNVAQEEKFWFVQEAGATGRYLRVHAHHMKVDDVTTELTFCNEDGTVVMRFGPGEWSFMEHGEAPFT